jgi:hypothetical protein
MSEPPEQTDQDGQDFQGSEGTQGRVFVTRPISGRAGGIGLFVGIDRLFSGWLWVMLATGGLGEFAGRTRDRPPSPQVVPVVSADQA